MLGAWCAVVATGLGTGLSPGAAAPDRPGSRPGYSFPLRSWSEDPAMVEYVGVLRAWDGMIGGRCPMPMELSHLERITTEYWDGRALLVSLRSDFEPPFWLFETDLSTLRRWMALNHVLGDEARTLRWVEAAEATCEGIIALRAVRPMIQELLTRHARWGTLGRMEEDAGRLIESMIAGWERWDAIQTIDNVFAEAEFRDMPAERLEEIKAVAIAVVHAQASSRPFQVADLHTSFLAAGRSEDARIVRERAAARLDAEALTGALVAAAERAGICHDDIAMLRRSLPPGWQPPPKPQPELPPPPAWRRR